MTEQEAISAAIKALGYEGADDAEACVRIIRRRGRWYATDAEYPEDTGWIHLGRARAVDERGVSVVHALARLLDASYLDGPPTDSQREVWRDAVAAARREHDRHVAALREIASWRAECAQHDEDMGHATRVFDEDEIAAVERTAARALRGGAR